MGGGLAAACHTTAMEVWPISSIDRAAGSRSMRNDLSGKRRRHRALFISDVHLGTRACQANDLLDFLREHDADTIYLVGDIIDFWRVRRGPIWLQSHNDVLQKLLRQVRKGARIVFIPGNHDEALREYCGTN